MPSPISVAQILELPIQERIRLVKLIWDSIAALPEEPAAILLAFFKSTATFLVNRPV